MMMGNLVMLAFMGLTVLLCNAPETEGRAVSYTLASWCISGVYVLVCLQML